MTPADDPVSGIFRKAKNRWVVAMLTRIMLGIPGAKAVHHYVPHFEVVAQVVIMLFELRKEEFALLGNTTAGSDGELFSLLQLANALQRLSDGSGLVHGCAKTYTAV